MSETPAPANRPRVICVDLDGTLLRTDTLVEMLVAALRFPRNWALLLRQLLAGRAALKREAAALAPLDPATLPYEESLLRYLSEERASGSRIVLATAADRAIAERINLHLGLFHEVIASDGANNVKGEAKGEALVKAFGEGGFIYVGNGRPDLAVWHRAGGGVVVNASPSIERRARQATAVELTIQSRPPWWRSLLRAMRPYQWRRMPSCSFRW